MAIIIVSPPAWDTGATCDGCGNSLKDRGSPEDKVYAAKLRQLDARAAGDQCTLWPYALHDGGAGLLAPVGLEMPLQRPPVERAGSRWDVNRSSAVKIQVSPPQGARTRG
jgi:hypothetical protein